MDSTIGRLQVEITAMTQGFNREIDGVKGKLNELESVGGKANQGLFDGFERVGKFGAKALQVGVVAAIAAIGASVPGAVRRIDTLANSGRVFRNLGFDAAVVDATMTDLVDSITGLPTPLESAVQEVQRLASSTGDLSRGNKVYQSLNNAVLGLGGSTEDVSGAVEGMARAYDRGALQGREWERLITAGLGPALNALAKQMGITTSDLQEGLSDGTISVEEFEKALIDANKNGAGSMKSFEEQARDATRGIGTSFTNVKNAITRGIEGIVTQLGHGDLEAGQARISDAIVRLGDAFEFALEKVGHLVSFLAEHKDIFLPIAVGIGSVVGWLTAWYIATQTLIKVKAIFNAVLAANPLGLLVLAIAAVVAGLIYFFTKTEAGQKIVEAFNDWIKDSFIPTIKSIGQWFVDTWDRINKAWSVVTGWFGGVVNGIIGFFSVIPGRLRGFFQGAWGSVTGIWGGAGGWFSGRASAIIGAFTGIPGRIRGYFHDALNRVKIMNWVKLGRDIVRGIAAGLSPTAITEKMKEIASGAMDTVKSFLGISSPSKVMRDEVGKMMGLGMADGIDASTKDAVKSASMSAKNVLGAYSLNSNLPSAGQLGSKLDISHDVRMSDMGSRQPIVLQLEDGSVLGNYVIDAINNKSFMANNSVIDF